jgi:hypothetical protein
MTATNCGGLPSRSCSGSTERGRWQAPRAKHKEIHLRVSSKCCGVASPSTNLPVTPENKAEQEGQVLELLAGDHRDYRRGHATHRSRGRA